MSKIFETGFNEGEKTRLNNTPKSYIRDKSKNPKLNIECECINNMKYSDRKFDDNKDLEKVESKEVINYFRQNKVIGQIITNHILSKQDEYSTKKLYLFYREHYKNYIEQEKTLLDLRRDIITEISGFIWKYHLKEEILFLAVNFMDNIIIKEQTRNKDFYERLRYLGYTCLYIAIKIERVLNINFKETLKRLSLNTSKILSMEKYVLNQLTFKLNPISSQFFLQYLMGILMESYLKEIVGHNIDCSPENNGFTHTQNEIKRTNLINSWNTENNGNSSSQIINTLNKKSSKGINRVLEYYIGCYILEICLYDIELLKYSPLYQAISALIIAKECLGAGKESYDKESFNEYIKKEIVMKEYIDRNINAIKRTLKYPFIKKSYTTKKYLTNEYMNAANYVLRFIYSKY
ncbi:Cyclin B like [Cryptosporidium felis]|nr:Cyclin B like [Cryptosporidium felis]